jgi:RsiW-degrading membrane proteinase PrsW (M82 family)
MSKGMKASIVFAIIITLQALCMLAFRAFIYADMYIAPGDPYGISDIIELLLYGLFLVLVVLACLFSIVLMIRGKRQNRVSGLLLLLWCVSLVLLFPMLHDIAANYRY